MRYGYLVCLQTLMCTICLNPAFAVTVESKSAESEAYRKAISDGISDGLLNFCEVVALASLQQVLHNLLRDGSCHIQNGLWLHCQALQDGHMVTNGIAQQHSTVPHCAAQCSSSTSQGTTSIRWGVAHDICHHIAALAECSTAHGTEHFSTSHCMHCTTCSTSLDRVLCCSVLV